MEIMSKTELQKIFYALYQVIPMDFDFLLSIKRIESMRDKIYEFE